MKNDKDINEAIAEEFKGNGFRDMKKRFKQLAFEFERTNVAAMINEYTGAAAFANPFARIAKSPLPVTKETLLKFLEKDNVKKEQKKN